MALYILVNTGSVKGLLPDGTKPLHEPMVTYYQLDQWTNFSEILIIKPIFPSRKYIWK